MSSHQWRPQRDPRQRNQSQYHNEQRRNYPKDDKKFPGSSQYQRQQRSGYPGNQQYQNPASNRWQQEPNRNWEEQPQGPSEINHESQPYNQTSQWSQPPGHFAQTPPHSFGQPPRQFNQPQLDQPPPQLNQPLPHLNQPPPHLNQPPPKLNQPPPQLNQPPPHLNQPPPQLMQPPPTFIQPPPPFGNCPPQFSQPPPNFTHPPPNFNHPPPPLHQPHQEPSQINPQGLFHQPDPAQQTTTIEQPDKDELQAENDKRWLEAFLTRKNKFSGKKSSKTPQIKIPEVKRKVVEGLQVMEFLKKQMTVLQTLEPKDDRWSCEYQIACDLKKRLGAINAELTEETMAALQAKISIRKKKRERLHRKRKEDYANKEAVLERREELHKTIDGERQKAVEKDLEIKKEKELKAQADKVLAEVRKKLQDSNKAIDLLKSVHKLRQLRKQTASQKGLNTPVQCDELFEKRTAHLLRMMERRQKVYEGEERTLKAMLEQEQLETKEKEAEVSKRKEMERMNKRKKKYNELLFGKKEEDDYRDPLLPYRHYYLQGEHNVDALIQIRREWDSYLTPGGSSIPPSWVLPPEPSSDTWLSALKTNT